MRGLQFIAFWLLLIFQVESQATTHRCNTMRDPFPSCNNSVLRVTKSSEQYQVILQSTEWQCFNDFCLVNDQKYRQRNILCNETCRACQQLQPQTDCGTNATICEVNVDVYLRDFCAQATFTRNRATICTPATITSELPCPTSTITLHSVQLTLVTVSSTLPHQWNMPNPVISTTPQTSIPPSLSIASRTLVTKSVELNYVPLGALLGLSLLLLAVVTTGWVCTCVSMKKREAKMSSIHNRISDLNDDDDDKTNEERCFQNSTYDDTNVSTAQPYEIALGPVGSLVNEKFPETAYDSINLPIQPTADNGQMYDVLNRSRANGSNLATEVGRAHNNGNYSQLALQEN